MIYKMILTDENGGVEEVLHFDVVSSVDESASNTAPASPVEEGLVFDHTYSSNNKFSLSAIITNTQFRDKSMLVTYRNGEFVRKFPTGEQGESASKVAVMKEKLKSMRELGKFFGLVACTEHNPEDPENINSQVEYYYPCIITELSFPYKDGGNAIYPSMTIEEIRITSVITEVVKDVPPQLIPYVRHGEQGNQSGGSASVSEDTDIVSATKAQVKDLTGEIPKMDDDKDYSDTLKNMQREIDKRKSNVEIINKNREAMDTGAKTPQQASKDMEAGRKANDTLYGVW